METNDKRDITDIGQELAALGDRDPALDDFVANLSPDDAQLLKVGLPDQNQITKIISTFFLALTVLSHPV